MSVDSTIINKKRSADDEGRASKVSKRGERLFLTPENEGKNGAKISLTHESRMGKLLSKDQDEDEDEILCGESVLFHNPSVSADELNSTPRKQVDEDDEDFFLVNPKRQRTTRLTLLSPAIALRPRYSGYDINNDTAEEAEEKNDGEEANEDNFLYTPRALLNPIFRPVPNSTSEYLPTEPRSTSTSFSSPSGLFSQPF